MLLRQEMGEALRHARQQQGRTLRDVCAAASVSLGYLSEVERGAKEPSSELLAAICAALDLPLSHLLRDVTGRVSRRERLAQPALAEPVQLPVAGRRDDTVDASAA